MSAPYGIDLGTTNSVIAHLVNGRPQAIPVAGSPIVPSVVLYQSLEGKDRVVVGREARNLALLHPAETVRSVKRRMGEEHVYEIAGRRLTPEDVSAEILRALKTGAEQATGEEVRDVVITVPAYFNDAQRRATLRAGELAGLNVLRLLNEPTAASLVYEHSSAVGAGEDGGKDGAAGPEIVLIYDLGGGTFDVSVLEVFDGVREVRATTGNSRLGGDDFDDLLLRHFLDELRVRAACDPRDDARAMARLSALAEDTKIKLSSQVEVQVREEFLTTSNGKPVHLDLTVTRRQFEELVRPLLESTIALAHRAVDDAQLTEQKLTRICLVGGSTRIPLVRQLLESAFAVDIHEEVDPDLAVGLGAAVQAALLSGVPVERILVDVNAHTLGIRAIGDSEIDHFAPILRRNTPLPTEKTEEFYTMMDQQAQFLLEVFQGESHRVSRNHKVGEYLIDLAPAPAHSPVQVRFSYDLDGVVKVLVAQPGAHKEKTVLFRVADASKDQRAPALAAQGRGHDDDDDLTDEEAVTALNGLADLIGVPAQPSTPQSALERKAQALLGRLSGPRRDELERMLGAYRAAGSPEDRARAEDRLLDFLMSAEDEEE